MRVRLFSAIATIAMVLVLLAPALWNGFPLIYPDTGGYLARPITGTLEMGRSALYGAFLLAGAPLRFWPNVLAQALATIWLVTLTLRAHGLGNRPLLALSIVVAVTVTTSLPFFVSQLMPDVLFPLAVLALYLLAFRLDALSMLERVSLCALIAFSMASHMALLGLALALMAGLYLLASIRPFRLPKPRLALAGLAIAVGVLTSPLSNLAITGKFAFTPGGVSFLFGRLVEDGIVTRYLDTHCPDGSLRICAYRNEISRGYDDWLWANDSPFWKLGGWQGHAAEERRIILATLATNPLTHLEYAGRHFAQQLTRFATEVSIKRAENAPTFDTFRDLLPQLYPALSAARQQAAPFDVSPLNALHIPAAIIFILILLGGIGYRNRIPYREPEVALAVTVLLALVVNAAICGVFSHPADRYQSRLIPLVAIAVFVNAAALRVQDPRSMLAVIRDTFRPISTAQAQSVMHELTPTGKLRVAIAVAPSPSAQFAIKDDKGGYRGVAVDLGTALAKKLGVPVELVAHQNSGEIQNSAAENKWDVAFLPVDEERKKFVDFGNAYHLLQSTYLVAPGSKIAGVEAANAPGVRIGGVANTATFRTSQKTAPNATPVTFKAVDEAIAAMKNGEVDAIALSRESLSGVAPKIPGSRILDGGFLNSTTSVAVPKGKPQALAYVTQFIEEAKASGLVRKAFDDIGLKSSQVAPAGMKP
jgi:ABC-type amino acid transport substrate-binding protein